MPPLDLWACALVLVKALTYTATLAGAGGVLFAGHSHELLASPEIISLERWLWTLLVIAAGASGLSILLTAGSMGSEIGSMFDPSLVRMVWSPDQARATSLRLIGLVLMSIRAGPARPRKMQLAGAILAATSFAWVGHTHAAADVRLAVFALAVHLMCVAYWIGALVPLLVVTRGADMLRLAALIARFSKAAMAVVGTLAAAGACVLWCLLAHIAELWTTPYGRTVGVKLALVIGLLALAALNRWRFTPGLRAKQTGALRHLRRSIRLELVMAVGILITTAAMTVLIGPDSLP